MTPERIYDSLVSGSMKMHAEGLSDDTKTTGRGIHERPATWQREGGRREEHAEPMPQQSDARRDPADGPAWNGWGADSGNTRFQPAQGAGLTAAQVPRLKLKWAFGYPAGESANGQPTVASGRVFVGSDNGFVYSLDAATGCVYWSFENGSIVRNALTIGPVTGQGRRVMPCTSATDTPTSTRSMRKTEDCCGKPKSIPTSSRASPQASKFYDGKLFVPVSSSEEFASGHRDYPCCTSRGSVVALDANTGKQIWKAWVVPDEPKPYKTQTNGVVLYKPAGGAVWNSPTVDPVRQAVYFGTGDATTAPVAQDHRRRHGRGHQHRKAAVVLSGS